MNESIPDEIQFEQWINAHFGSPMERLYTLMYMDAPFVVQFILNGRPGVTIHDVLRQTTDLDNCAYPIPALLRSYETLEVTVKVPNFAAETFWISLLVHGEAGPPRWMTIGELAYELCKPERQWARLLEYHRLLGLEVPVNSNGRGCTLIICAQS